MIVRIQYYAKGTGDVKLSPNELLMLYQITLPFENFYKKSRG